MKNKSAKIQKQWRIVLCLCIILFASRAYAQVQGSGTGNCSHMYNGSRCHFNCSGESTHMCKVHGVGCPTDNSSTGTTSGSGNTTQDAILNGVQGALTQGMTTFFTNTLFKPKPKPVYDPNAELQRQKEVTERWEQQWKYQKYTDSVNAAQTKNLQLSKQELEERKQKKDKDCDNMLTMLKAHPEYWAQWKDYMKLNCGMEPPQSQAAELAKAQLVQKVAQKFLERDTASERRIEKAMNDFNMNSAVVDLHGVKENAVVKNLKEDWQAGWGVPGGGSPVIGLKEGWPTSPRLKIEENVTVPDLTKEQLEMLRQEREKKTNAFVDWVSKETEKADYAAADFVKQNSDEIKSKVNEIMEEKVVKTMTGGMAESIDDLIPSQFKVIKKTHDDYTKFLGELMPAYLNDLSYGSPEKLADDNIGVNKFGMKVAGIEDYSDKWKPPVKK